MPRRRSPLALALALAASLLAAPATLPPAQAARDRVSVAVDIAVPAHLALDQRMTALIDAALTQAASHIARRPVPESSSTAAFRERAVVYVDLTDDDPLPPDRRRLRATVVLDGSALGRRREADDDNVDDGPGIAVVSPPRTEAVVHFGPVAGSARDTLLARLALVPGLAAQPMSDPVALIVRFHYPGSATMLAAALERQGLIIDPWLLGAGRR